MPETISTLDDWLNYIEKLHAKPIDLGLDRMKEMIRRLGIGFASPVITVAGTNGKGSTCTFIETIFREAGFRTALHTSPHLLRFNERALLDGREVNDESLIRAFREVEKARAGMPLTYFEFTGLGILKCFQDAKPDVVILEIGLGGRLDAINAADPDVSVVAAVGIDHTAFLGDTREKIGLEKAHIFRSGKPAICSDPEPPQSLIEYAHEIGAKLSLINRDFRVTEYGDGSFRFSMNDEALELPRPGLAGENQYRNAAGAIAAVLALKDRLPVDREAFARGIARARITARFERVSEDPCETILDVGHNPQAAEVLADNLRRYKRPDEVTLAVFGMLTDKDRAKVAATLAPEIDEWFYAGLPGPRGGEAALLAPFLEAAGVAPSAMTPSENVSQALEKARVRARELKEAGKDVRIIIFGSFVTVGEALECLAREGIRR